MDDAVAGHDVGGDDGCITHRHRAGLGRREFERAAVDGGRRRAVSRDLVGRNVPGEDVIFEQRDEIAAIGGLKQLGRRAFRQRRERIVGWREHGERARAFELHGQPGFLHEIDEGAELAGLVGDFDDVARQRIRQRRRRRIRICAVDAVVATDAAGIILEANPACQTIFGHDPTGLIGENVRLLTPAEHSHKHDYYIRHYIETGASEIVGKVREVEGRHADGHAIPIELAVTEYREGEEHIFVATARDLSDRKQTEAEREAFIARLEASNAELERFSFAASHDLREPLRMIGSFSQMLNKRYADQLDADGRRALNICAQSASRMQALLDDLISFSRASDDLGQVETLLPADMIELARQNLAEEIEHTEASFAIIHMPPAMRANPTRFLRVFQNLIANAIKYAKVDATPRIQISASPFEQGWLFTVSDNGIGMKSDYCEQIFEPFKRLHSPSEYSGTGMGLAICRKIVTAAGGRIWAESEPDKGSRFYVYWPDLEASDVADLAETKGEEA